MEKRYIDIEGKWGVVFAYDIKEDDLDEIASWLEALGATRKEVRKARRVVMRWNSGLTFSNDALRMSVMIVSKSTSREQFMNTLSHEIGHLKYDICVYYDVEDGSEEEMYLQGYIMQRIIRAMI